MTCIDLHELLRDLPRYKTFCSVSELQALVETLREDRRFDVKVAGESSNGVPIHHVSCGSGPMKALFVAFPHCMEPIGSLAVHGLMTLLKQGHPALFQAGVEWHIVPCIDPDGAILNEGWACEPFTLESYLRNFYVQPPRHQADMSLPLEYKKLSWTQPSREARIMQEILDRVRPDFLFSLHNARPAHGTFFLATRDLGEKCYRQILRLMSECDVPLNDTAPRRGGYVQLGESVYERGRIQDAYDYFETQGDVAAEEVLAGVGAGAPDYLQGIKPDALTFIAELDYVRLPAAGLDHDTGQSSRQLKLRLDAENKFLASAMLEEWDKVADELDPESPFYRKFHEELVMRRHKLHEELPLMWSFEQTRNLMFNAMYDGTMTERDRVLVWIWSRFMPLCNAYGFVRLLQGTRGSTAVRQARDRMESLFEQALEEMKRSIDFGKLTAIDCDTLAKASLGSGLIALNSVLELRGQGS